MDIELKEITIAELSNGFQDNNENGVIGFNGNLRRHCRKQGKTHQNQNRFIFYKTHVRFYDFMRFKSCAGA